MKSVIKIMKMSKRYWPAFTVAFISMLLATAASLYSPQVLKNFIALFQGGGDDIQSRAVSLAVILLITYLLEALGTFGKSYFNHYVAWKVVHDVRVKLYDHVQNLSLKFFHDKQTGELLSRIINDTRTIELLIAHAFPESITHALTFLGVLTILLLTNVPLTLLSFLVVPLLVFLIYRFTTKVRPLFRKTHEKTAELSAVIHDDLSGIREINIFNRHERELGRVEHISEDFTHAIIGTLKKSAIYHPAIAFLNKAGTIILIAVSGTLAVSGHISLAEVLVFIFYLEKLYAPINSIGRLSEDLQNAGTAADRIVEIMNVKSSVVDSPDAFDMGKAEGRIEYRDVFFEYQENRPIIKNFNLTVEKGQSVALVGPTGVGKTTLASLTARFYDPTGGDILIDGINIKDVTQKSLHDNMSIVLQDVFLFNGTIAENIAYGIDNASEQDIINAAKVANAHEFIKNTENGYDTMIGERGMRLSGGQKQRLSIARAILKNSPILILDEATASVDNETEKLIHQAIDKVIQNRTTIIIAHRLSTIKSADKIVVISEGGIAEMGTHEQLMKKGGMYASLYNSAGEIIDE